jgi:hypothetical protein
MDASRNHDLYWSPSTLQYDDNLVLPTPPSSVAGPSSLINTPFGISPLTFDTSFLTTTAAPLLKRPRKVSSKSTSMDPDLEDPSVKATAKPVKTPRPANAWICYRSARVQELKTTAEYKKLPQADICSSFLSFPSSSFPVLTLSHTAKIIGQLWRNETDEIKRKYEQIAEVKKAEHKAKHPGAFPPSSLLKTFR